MLLEKYNRKRVFTKTPEPRGQIQPSRGALKFVIQKHQASRLHYDFRLEMEGVLKSWAVPKGLSLNPADKRLAMMTEDHPMAYRTFEGTIPEDEYGGGDVIVWDEGTYEADGTSNCEDSETKMLAGLAKGDMKFTLYGSKIQGSYALIKMKGRQENAWLLIKHKDEFVSDRDITADQTSARSNKALGDEPHSKIYIGGNRRQAAPKTSPKPKINKASKNMPHNIRPMLATLTNEPFDNPDWLYEIKWDGYRAVAEVEDGAVKLYSRTGQPFEHRYPAVVAALTKLQHNGVLDGEIVSLDNTGKSHFQYLQNYDRDKQGKLQYRVFDLLYLDGEDLRQLPLIERKKKLQNLLPGKSIIQYSDHVTGKGLQFFEQATKQGLEGIMAKDGRSVYETGRRSESWLKIKTHQRQEAVICGFTAPQGSRKYFGSLILGVYEHKKLRYVGHTGTGFNQQSLKYIYDHLVRLETDDSPFEKPPKTNAPVTWVKPKLLAEVEFSEWTADGQMRHPSFQGLREDKPAEAVTQEKPVTHMEAKLTNLDKIYWPKEKITKGDLIEYYKSVSSIILPYLENRPQSLHRHPNGITAESFFQKNITVKVPEFVETVKLQLETEKRAINSIVCNNEQTLLYLANLGCIEINPWNARVGQLEYPDWGVIDLDPEQIGFDKVVEAARVTHKILENIDVPSYPKTSGKTGLHIFIPLGGKYTHDQAKQFIELVVTLVHHRLPQTTSLERSPDKRKKRIYLDYLQNRIGQTLAAPYSVRPWPGATVSTPLLWREVTKGLDPKRFTIKTLPARLQKLGDIWQPVIGKGINLKQALAKLEASLK